MGNRATVEVKDTHGLDDIVASGRSGGGADRASIGAERTLAETPFVGAGHPFGDDVDPGCPPFGEFGIGALKVRADDGHELRCYGP